MDINVNAANIRSMAQRLRKVVGTPMPQSKAFEVLSQVFVGKNWDTLCAMLKQEAEPAVVLDKPVRLFVGAFSCIEFGKSPSWAEVRVDNAFLKKVSSLQALCARNELAHVATYDRPQAWGDNSNDQYAWATMPQESLNIQGDQLYVNKNNWWYHGVPKHADYAVESRAINIELLLAVLTRKLEDSKLAWRDDVLVYDSVGDIDYFVESLVETRHLSESYLKD